MRAHAGLIEGVDLLPEGPEIGAFFDFDGTIIAGYSGLVLLREQIRRRELSVAQVVQTSRAMLTFGLGSANFSAMMVLSTQFMAGMKESDLGQTCEQLFQREVARLIYPESRALIAAHLRRGHTVVIVTSATSYQVAPAAASLGISHLLCSRLQVGNGKFTGEVIRPLCFGVGKLQAAEEFAGEHGVNLDQSCFYSDSYDDIALLERVGLPRPINPNRKLNEVAMERGWPVYRFTSRGRPSAAQTLRSILATGSLLATVAASLPIRALTGSRRDAQNFSTSLYADVASALIGLTLTVTGEENLWQQRPAVFVFNHQSKADFIIIARLLRRDFTGIARKHSGGSRFYHQVMEAGGVLLIDLDQPRETLATMRALAKDVREQGISVAIAPEGTRSIGTRPGAFNKGAFHLAMQAGVPVVPIVIHNALDVAPKGDSVCRPATVDVDVLPPIDTRDWKKATLATHVADVRRQFLDVLGHAE